MKTYQPKSEYTFPRIASHSFRNNYIYFQLNKFKIKVWFLLPEEKQMFVFLKFDERTCLF